VRQWKELLADMTCFLALVVCSLEQEEREKTKIWSLLLSFLVFTMVKHSALYLSTRPPLVKQARYEKGERLSSHMTLLAPWRFFFACNSLRIMAR